MANAEASRMYMDALSEYLQGEEWQQSVEMFVNENCGSFRSSKEFSHDQHKLWQTYHEIVETILDMALGVVGGNLSALERALASHVDKPVRGPRDAATRDVLERLLTYTNFEHFSHMMHRAYHDRHASGSNDRPRSAVATATDKLNRHRDSLVTLGFAADAVDHLIAVKAAEGLSDATLEDLVIEMSAIQASGPGSSGSGARGPGHSPAKGPGGAAGTSADGRALELAMNAQSFRTAASPTPAKLQFLQKFIDDGPNGGLKEDVSELFAKFTMARSVLETFNDSGNTSDDILTLLDWATDMLALHADILACYHDGKVRTYTSILLSSSLPRPL